MSVKAGIVNISRGSLHDGNGVRTVVYLKGCNMHCKWCHNPESIVFERQILFAESKCIHCGLCIATCPEHHVVLNSQHLYIKEGCTACGRCAQICPVNALMLCGEEKSAQDVFEEILKDKHYYDTSSGGVTFSGGECLLHPDFMREITGLCKEANISVVVESALNIPWQNIEPLLPYINSFFVDIKHMDSGVHKRYTGCENSRILENVKLLAQKHPSIIIRVPLIPSVNDSLENLVKTAQFSKSCGNGIKGMELLAYNTLGESKYSLLHEEYISFSNEPQTNNTMDDLCKHINRAINEDAYVYYIK